MNPFLRKRACGSCPFRSRVPAHGGELEGELFRGLTPQRVGQIAASLREGAMFPCHKSVDYSVDEGVGARPAREGEHWCAGALTTILNTGEAWNNPGTRFAAAAGMFDPADFQAGVGDVYPTLEEWAAALTARYEETP